MNLVAMNQIGRPPVRFPALAGPGLPAVRVNRDAVVARSTLDLAVQPA